MYTKLINGRRDRAGMAGGPARSRGHSAFMRAWRTMAGSGAQPRCMAGAFANALVASPVGIGTGASAPSSGFCPGRSRIPRGRVSSQRGAGWPDTDEELGLSSGCRAERRRASFGFSLCCRPVRAPHCLAFPPNLVICYIPYIRLLGFRLGGL